MISVNSKERKLMLQLVSLMIALLMWVRISGSVDAESALQTRVYPQVSLIFPDLPEDWKVESVNYQFQVTLSGKEQELDTIDSSDIQIKLDLGKEYNEGTYNLPVAGYIRLPPNANSLQVLGVTPDFVNIDLVHYTTKKLRIVVRAIGDPAENYEIKDIVVTPETATVRGPTKAVKDLNLLLANPISIEGLSATSEGLINFDFKETIPEKTVIKEWPGIRYRAVVEEITKTLKPKRSYNIEISESEGFEIDPQKARLEIEGPITVIQWFDPEWVLPRIVMPKEPVTNQQPPESAQPPEGEAANQPVKPEGARRIAISNHYVLPEEAQTAAPDWKERVDRLTFRWKPAEVEVKRQ